MFTIRISSFLLLRCKRFDKCAGGDTLTFQWHFSLPSPEQQVSALSVHWTHRTFSFHLKCSHFIFGICWCRAYQICFCENPSDDTAMESPGLFDFSSSSPTPPLYWVEAIYSLHLLSLCTIYQSKSIILEADDLSMTYFAVCRSITCSVVGCAYLNVSSGNWIAHLLLPKPISALGLVEEAGVFECFWPDTKQPHFRNSQC